MACLMLGTAFLGYRLLAAYSHNFNVAFESVIILHRIRVKLHPVDDCS